MKSENCEYGLIHQNDLDPAIGSSARVQPGKRLIRAISDNVEARCVSTLGGQILDKGLSTAPRQLDVRVARAD